MAMENVVVDCFLLNIKTNNGNAINSECECELGKILLLTIYLALNTKFLSSG